MIHCFAKAIIPYHLYVQLNLRKTKDLIDVEILFLSNNFFLSCGLCFIISIVTIIETKQNCLVNLIFLINIYLYLMNIFCCILVIFCSECFSISFIVIFIWVSHKFVRLSVKQNRYYVLEFYLQCCQFISFPRYDLMHFFSVYSIILFLAEFYSLCLDNTVLNISRHLLSVFGRG